ncbi:MAG: YggT family protein [Microbacteriaceae bacterium]
MIIIESIAGILSFLLLLFQILLWVYFGISLFMTIRRDWRPRGAVLFIVDLSFRIVEPPLKLVRKFVPSLDLGGFRLDLAWMILLFATIILRGMVGALPAFFS